MVDQAQVNSPGRQSAAPIQAARGTADLLHDMLTLAELQWQLFALDGRQYVRGLLWPAVWLACGTALALSCLPLALVVLALALVETTSLSIAQAFGVALAVGFGLALGLIGSVVWFVRRRLVFLQRSKSQWQQNLRWLKDMLQRVKQFRS